MWNPLCRNSLSIWFSFLFLMISKSIFIGIFLLLSIEAEAQTIWDVTFVSNSFQGVPWGVSFSGDNGTGIGGIFS